MLPYVSYTQTQTPEDSKSNTVRFSQNEACLIQKEFYSLGQLKGGITFDALVLTNMKTHEKTGGVVIKIQFQSSVYGNAEFPGTIDYDELDSCLKSLRTLQDSLTLSSPFTYTEYDISTRDGIMIRVFHHNKKGWQAIIQTKRNHPDSAKQIDIKELVQVTQFLNDAKIIIEEQMNLGQDFLIK